MAGLRCGPFWKGREHGGPVLGTCFDLNRAAVQRCNLPTSASPSPAPPYALLRDLSRRKNGWKMLSRYCLVFPGLIFDSQEHVTVVVADGDVDSGAGAAVTDGIFDQVKHQPIEERVASDYQSASTAIEDDVFMLGKRSKVGEDFFGQGAKLNIVLAGNACGAHSSQAAPWSFATSARFVLGSRPSSSGCLGLRCGMLGGEQFNLRCIRASGVRSSCAALPVN